MKKNYLVLFFIFIIFIILTLFVSIHHEPWADEAHSWLIARDCSFKEIALDVLKYEVHPFGWHWIVKIFILCGLPYEYYFVIPCLFTYIGVAIFLFKTEFPLYIKVLFPFSFFVFFQYTVVARSYCLILPLLLLIGISYKKRLEKPFVYSCLLSLLCFIHLYTIFLALALAILFFIDIKKSEKNNKYLIYPFFVFITIVTISAIIFPPLDLLHKEAFLFHLSEESPVFYLNKFFLLFSNALYANNFQDKLGNGSYCILACNIFIFLIFIFLIYKISINLKRFLFLNISVMLPMFLIYFNYWHLGILYYTFLFSLWILVFDNKSEKNELPNLKNALSILIISVFIIQIYYSFVASYNDYKYPYCASQKAQQYLKNIDRSEISGVDFKPSSLGPYFNEKLFKNYGSLSFYSWKESYTSVDKTLKNPTNIIVSEVPVDKRIEDFVKNGYYRETFFNGELFFKNKVVENNSLIVYEKIEP